MPEYALVITIAALALFAISVVCLCFDSSRARSESKWFIERQQMQSKIDVLTEALLQHSGHPIDLNKQTRELFKSKLQDNVFRRGWAMDKPATPPKEGK
jgi:hypothetical protein